MMQTMHAMALERPRRALVMSERPIPTPARGEIMVMVTACGVCRTDLHVVDGELSNPRLPIVPGHEIVGHVRALGPGVGGFAIDERVGVPWLGATCGVCAYCRGDRENLCDNPVFTGPPCPRHANKFKDYLAYKSRRGTRWRALPFQCVIRKSSCIPRAAARCNPATPIAIGRAINPSTWPIDRFFVILRLPARSISTAALALASVG